MVSIEEFNKFCQIAKEHHIKSFSIGEHLKVEFDEEPTPIIQTKDAPTIPHVEGMPTEDQMLLWSSPFMPERKGDSNGENRS